MARSVLVAFLVGCVVGGLVVGLWLRSAAPASTPAATVAVTAPTSSGAPPAVASTSPAFAAPGAPGDDRPRADVAPRTAPDETQRSDPVAGGYSFSNVTNSEKQLEDIFNAERVDPAWSTQTVDTLNLVMSAMPERSVIGDYGLTCKDSLCKLEIKGTSEQLAGTKPDNNVQVAMHRMMQNPPASDIFDDYTMHVGFDDKDGLTTITLFAHRRNPK